MNLRQWINAHPFLATTSAAAIVVAFSTIFILDFQSAKADKGTVYPPYVAAAAPTPVKPQIVYDPPAKERVYEKSEIEGKINTVTFHGSTETTGDEEKDKSLPERYEPDYTRVKYSPAGDGQQESVDFCGNELEHFTPGQKIKMILRDSNLTDYNGCYFLAAPTPLTFGGKPNAPAVPTHSTVPGLK